MQLFSLDVQNSKLALLNNYGFEFNSDPII